MADGDLENTIRQAAQAPASVNIDGNSATAQDIGKLIEADLYVTANRAVARRHRGVRTTKLAAPGSVY
jgi:hypothetical protein